MVDKEFNLLREPWILAIRPDGETEEVSLVNLFRRAPEFRSLAGELPTQDVAVLRLLLAVLHTVFSRYDTQGRPVRARTPMEALQRWKSLWDRSTFPMEVIENYLNQYEDRFWLFHPERPFYQVAGLVKRDDVFGPFNVSKLIGELAESDHKTRLFPQRSGNGKTALNYAEAARWLLYYNSYAETFGKLEAKCKPSKSAPTLGVGWLGKLGLIDAIGSNLFETLLLNIVFLKDGSGDPWGQEKPVWENDESLEERQQISVPDNPSQLLTLQSRQIQLIRDNGLVVQYCFLAGEFFVDENAISEMMTVWRNTAKNPAEKPIFQPKRHDASRQLWRDFAELIAQSTGCRRPGIISWLAKLKSQRLITGNHIRFQTASVLYGNMQAVIADTFSDSLSLNANLLTELGNVWVNRIVEEISYTEQLVDRLGNLARDLAKAAGDSDDNRLTGERDAARQQAYYRLDEPFRRWLEEIDPEKGTEEIDDICDLWWEEAKRIVRALASELVEQAGTKAFVGRDVTEKIKGKETKRRYTSPEVHSYFLRRTANRQALKGGEQA